MRALKAYTPEAIRLAKDNGLALATLEIVYDTKNRITMRGAVTPRLLRRFKRLLNDWIKDRGTYGKEVETAEPAKKNSRPAAR